MPTEPTRKPPPAQNHQIFDPWNSVSTGHQRAENPYSHTAAWRDTRARKLERQFRSGDCAGTGDGGTHASMAFDGTFGPSSPEEYRDKGPGSGAGEWRWVSEVEATRSQLGVRDIRSFMAVGKRKAGEEEEEKRLGKRKKGMEKLGVQDLRGKTSTSTSTSTPTSTSGTTESEPAVTTDATSTTNPESKKESATKQIFAGTSIYVNGSTLPQISDHKLKHLLVLHGAQISISMARKTVSHVIVGQPGAAGAGAGGGLAARKLQQEIERGGWKGVKVVGVDWVLESIKAGKRLAEWRFAVLSVAPKGQRSVAGMLGAG